MYFRVGVILYAFAISGITAARAQMCLEDTIRVEEVTIYSTYRQLHTIGTNTIKIDTLRLTNFEGKSLTELLQSTGVNIRSYGVGGLATIAVRGGGSSHTAVVWNGINLQSPLNGGVNLSQFPVSLFSSVTVQHGGNGTVYGSGAVSGIVILENGGLLLQPNGARAGFTYGSGNTRGANASVKIGNSKSALSLKYSGLIADNDFEFINTYKFGNPRERITNAQAAQHGILADAVLRFDNNALWNISGWFTHNDKNVQTLMSSSQISQANQLDNNFAVSSNLTGDLPFFSLKLRNAFINGDNHFTDPASGISSLNTYKQLVNEIELKKTMLKHQELVVGLGYSVDIASSQSYTENALRNRISAYASLVSHLLGSRIKLVLSLRDELVDGSLIPLVASSGLEYKATKSLMLRASAASSYRLPTLNDLYWSSTTYAVGNPNLEPEYGWNTDLGFDYTIIQNALNLKFSGSYFISRLNRWIVWLPDAQDNNRWKPSNISTGKSEGFESFIILGVKLMPISIRADLSYTLTNSKIYDSGSYNGKPMIYIPRHKVGASISIIYGQFNFGYNHSFTSERYTDELNTLPLYNLGDIYMGYSCKAWGSAFTIGVGVNNVWNEQYQLVRNYAMPLRNYFIRLNIDFQSKSTNIINLKTFKNEQKIF